MKSAERTNATIAEIVKRPCFGQDTDSMTGEKLTTCTSVYVKFSNNGIEYEEKLNGSTVFMKKGDNVIIYYQINRNDYGLKTIEIFHPFWFVYISIYFCAVVPFIMGIVFFKRNMGKINDEFLKLSTIVKNKN